MGLFDYLFGGRKHLGEDVLVKSEKRVSLFNKHLREVSAKINYFIYHSDSTLALLAKDPDKLNVLLDDIEAGIGRDIVDIEDEEKLESDIIADLKMLDSSIDEAGVLKAELFNEVNLEANIRQIFHKHYQILATELHMIKLIREKLKENDLDKVTELLLALRKLVTTTEVLVSSALKPGFGSGVRGLPSKLKQVIHAILLEQEINEEELAAGKKSRQSTKKQFKASPESKPSYKQLFDRVYNAIIKKFGAPFADYDEYEKVSKEIDRLILEDTDALRSIILAELKKTCTEEDMSQIIQAFRDAYTALEFREIDLYT